MSRTASPSYYTPAPSSSWPPRSAAAALSSAAAQPTLGSVTSFGEAMLQVHLMRERFEKARQAMRPRGAGGAHQPSFTDALQQLLQSDGKMFRNRGMKEAQQHAAALPDKVPVPTEAPLEIGPGVLGSMMRRQQQNPGQQQPAEPQAAWIAPLKAEPEPVEAGPLQVEIAARQSVGRLAGQMQVRGADVLERLSVLGHRSRKLTDFLDATVAELIVQEFGMQPVRLDDAALTRRQGSELSLRRGPVVCVMGHVDHGKTTLLDTLRKEQRALYEAGNITQAIGAFRVDLSEQTAEETAALPSSDRALQLATFLDTPGHAAFRAMRERGARSSCTDLIVLVVSAVDGVQPQTVEVIELSKQHSVPLIVAINKCDVEGADPQRVKEQLCMYDVVVEELGGDVLAAEISAKLGTGIPQLKESILLASDMLDLHAPATGPASCYVIESRRERNQGCVVNLVVRAGELRVGDFFVCGLQTGPIRALVDERGKKLEVATPSMAVQLLGATALEDMTEDLQTVKTEEEAAVIVAARRDLVDTVEIEKEEGKQAETEAAAPDVPTEVYKIKAGRGKFRVAVKPLSEEERKAAEEREQQSLSLIVKADVMGSLEALLDYVHKLPSDQVSVLALRSGIGEVNEGDVLFAEQMGAMVVGFNVPISSGAQLLARARNVPVVSRDIIYYVMDEIRDAASRKLPVDTEMAVVGSAEVLQLFPQKRKRPTDEPQVVAGVKVAEGELRHNALFRGEEGGRGRGVRGQPAEPEALRTSPCRRWRPARSAALMLQHWSEVEQGDRIECVQETRTQRIIDDSAARGFETVHNPKYDIAGAEREEAVRRSGDRRRS